VNKALVLAERGFTDADLAGFFGVCEDTINNWKKVYPQFFESLKKGKDIADQKVVQSLYQRALGYSHPEVHISNFRGKITITPIIKHYPSGSRIGLDGGIDRNRSTGLQTVLLT
jgi:hypothetical protein